MPSGDNRRGQPSVGARSAARVTKRRAARKLYEGSELTVAQVAAEVGVDATTLRDWIREEGWTPRAAEDNPAGGRPPKTPALALPYTGTPPPLAKMFDLTLEEIERKTARDVVLSHRRDLAIARVLVHQLMAELHVQAAMAEHVLAIQQVLTEGIEDPRALMAMRASIERILSVPGRSTALKNIVDTMAKLQVCERVAMGLKEGDIPPDDDEQAAGEQTDVVEFVWSGKPPPTAERAG